jgi:hypothetical protein
MLANGLKELLLAFNAHGVKYLLVGGYAVGVYAEPRATKDLDLFIRPDRINAEIVHRALAAYGAPLQGITPSDFFSDPHSVFQIGQPPIRIDILQQIDGVTFDDASSNRIKAEVGGISAHVISADDLIQNKLASGRLRGPGRRRSSPGSHKGEVIRTGPCLGRRAVRIAPGYTLSPKPYTLLSLVSFRKTPQS